MESELSYWLILLICFVSSAIFSASETALTTMPETYFRQIVEAGKGFIKPYELWLSRPNRVLTAIIIGNNLVNTLAAVVATIYAQKVLEHYVISIATGSVTLALLIFGEITPKTFARHNARAIVSVLIYIIYPIYYVLFPAVWLLSHFAVFLVHRAGGSTSRTGPLATEEDIAYLIRLSHEEGVFKPEQGKMLQSVMAFRDTNVREIMVPRTDICSFTINTSYKDIMSAIARFGYTRWPVYEDDIDHVLGILYVKDLINFHVSGGHEFILRNHLRRAIFIPESMKIDAVLRDFQRQKVHLAIIVDEYGGTAGVVTLEDILEEIVGEIRDEYDKEEEEETIKKVADDHYIADGRTSISDLYKKCGVELPSDESFESIGGFIVHYFGKIPKKNAQLQHGDWQLRVLDVEEKRVLRVEITKTRVLDKARTS
jgi:putative hemolysin